MVAFNFKKDFAPLIREGKKISTIRRNKRCAPGDTVQLYTGQRTKKCKLILESLCVGVAEITIYPDRFPKCGPILSGPFPFFYFLPERVFELEGFTSTAKMVEFFEDHYDLPFKGWLHVWNPPQKGKSHDFCKPTAAFAGIV